MSTHMFKKISFHLVSFAAGALLAAGIISILPQAIELNRSVYIPITIFIAVFFTIEKVFFRMHHHEYNEKETIKLPLPFLLSGDALYNVVAGIAIASTFLVSVPTGIITTLTVFIHEIPHKLTDFNILLQLGNFKKRAVRFNILTGTTTFIGAFLGFYFGRNIEGILPILLALTTANFIYLSLSDLLPELHHETKSKHSFSHTVPFFLGALLVIILTSVIKG